MDFELVAKIACRIQAISIFAYNIHYNTRGKDFYENHLFSEKIGERKNSDNFKDEIFETVFLGRGKSVPSSKDIEEGVLALLPPQSKNDEQNYKLLRGMISACLVDMESLKDMSFGEKDLFGRVSKILQKHNGLLFARLRYDENEVVDNSQEQEERWKRLIVDNDRWITVHPNKENPDDYRRLKVETGETSKEAIERKYGKSKNKEEKTEEKSDYEKYKEGLESLDEEELKKEREDVDRKKEELRLKRGQYIQDKVGALQKEIDELREKRGQLDENSENWEKDYDAITENINKIRAEMSEGWDKFGKEFDDKNFSESYELTNKSIAISLEYSRRESEKRHKKEKQVETYQEKINKLAEREESLSEKEYEEEKEKLKKEIEDSEILDNLDKFRLKKSMTESLGKVMFERKVESVKKSLQKYNTQTENIVKKLETFESFSEKYEKERAIQREENNALYEKYEKAESAEEKAKLKEEFDRRDKEYHRNYIFSSDRILKDMVSVKNFFLGEFGDSGVNIEIPRYAKGSYGKERFEEITSALGGLIGKSYTTKNPPKIYKKGRRANYDSAGNVINIGSINDPDVSVHEYLHFLEERNPKMLENSKAFLEYRTRGEEKNKLSSITGKPYNNNEVAKKDSFFNPYCGKMYCGGESYRTADATELMSMGVQRLLTEPKSFAKEDREYFDFVIANLRGEL